MTEEVIFSSSSELDRPEHDGGGFQMPDSQQRTVHGGFPLGKPEFRYTIGLIIRGAMVNNEKTVLELTKRLVNIQSDIVHLQAFVSVLKACVAVLLMPEDTEEALKYLSHLEELILKADPTEPARKRVLEVIDALQTLRRRGSSGLDS